MKKFKKLNKKLLLLFISVIFFISCKLVKTNDEVGTNNTEVVKTNIGTAADSPENIRKKIKNAKNNLKLKYSKKIKDFKSDIIFANFRNVQVGNLKQNILYRGASPIDNSFNRAKYADELI